MQVRGRGRKPPLLDAAPGEETMRRMKTAVLALVVSLALCGLALAEDHDRDDQRNHRNHRYQDEHQLDRRDRDRDHDRYRDRDRYRDHDRYRDDNWRNNQGGYRDRDGDGEPGR